MFFKAWLMIQQFNLFGADNWSKEDASLGRKGEGWGPHNYIIRWEKEREKKKDTVHAWHAWDS